MFLIYISHPYGGLHENEQKVQRLITDLVNHTHPLTAIDSNGIRRCAAVLTGKETIFTKSGTMTREDLADAVFISPIHQLGFLYDQISYVDGLKKCLALLERCDAVIFSGDWQHSRGCMAEYAYALANRIPRISADGDDLDAM